MGGVAPGVLQLILSFLLSTPQDGGNKCKNFEVGRIRPYLVFANSLTSAMLLHTRRAHGPIRILLLHAEPRTLCPLLKSLLVRGAVFSGDLADRCEVLGQ